MEQFLIKGPKRLSGKIKISGSKNAALPIIAASILTRNKVILHNIPRIKDIFTLNEILAGLGADIDFHGNDLTIDCSKINKSDPDERLVRNLRASILLVSPLLVQNGSIRIPHPGGCLIGSRPIDVHLNAYRKMGTNIEEDKNCYSLKADKLRNVEISADFSVTGTENIIMASVLTPGTTKIFLSAAEPHVQDLCHFLNQCGANISGIGTHNIKIKGVRSLNGCEYTIIPDQIESGTFAIAAAASKGNIEIDGFVSSHHESLLSKFDVANVPYKILTQNRIIIETPHLIKPFNLRTEIYPGFPTDLQAPMAVLATQASGTSEIYETIFEGRLGYVGELSKMGASCVVRDAHQASIIGPTPLFGTRITSFDLRAGATLIMAAIIAQGESRLDQIEVIDRGYENIDKKFHSLGADIKRVTLKEIS